MGCLRAPEHRSGHEFLTGRRVLLGQASRQVDADRAHRDVSRPLFKGFGKTPGPVNDLLGRVVVGQHGDDEVGVGKFRGSPRQRRSPGDQVFRFCFGSIVDRDCMTGDHKTIRDGMPHVSQSDESNFRFKAHADSPFLLNMDLQSKGQSPYLSQDRNEILWPFFCSEVHRCPGSIPLTIDLQEKA